VLRLKLNIKHHIVIIINFYNYQTIITHYVGMYEIIQLLSVNRVHDMSNELILYLQTFKG